MKQFLNFIQYHNGTVLLAVFIVGFAGSVFAAGEMTQVLNTPTEDIEHTELREDTTILLETDLNTFNTDLRILSAVEGETLYTVTYQFNTLSIKDGIWQEVVKTDTLEIEKTALLGTDVTTYAYEELSEVLKKERTFLTEVQIVKRRDTEPTTKLKTFTNLSFEDLKARTYTEREIEDVPAPEDIQETIETVTVPDEVPEDTTPDDTAMLETIVDDSESITTVPEGEEAPLAAEAEEESTPDTTQNEGGGGDVEEVENLVL